MVRKVNEDVNLPFVSEAREARLIEKFVDKILPKVEPSLQAIMPAIYVRWVSRSILTTFRYINKL